MQRLSDALVPILVILVASAPCLRAQTAPVTISLHSALERAQKYGVQIESADIAARLAHEDAAQARAASLPTVTGFNQFIYTEGNGTASGVFVANDGVHVYNEQLQAHEEVFAFVRRGEIRLAAAAEAVARAKADVARRGLRITVVQDYYSVASALRKLQNANRSLDEAKQFLDITQKQEQHGEAAHSDFIKAQLQVQQRLRDVQDAETNIQKAKIALAVLIFPSLNLNYSIVDDLNQIPMPPPLTQTATEAKFTSPDVVAARAGVAQAKLGLTVARYQYLPSLGLDVFYGIDANQFAASTNHPTQESGRSTLPDYQVSNRQNLGYAAQATLNIPLWNWGATHSKVKQAALKERQAELDLTTTQKQLQADLATANQEVETAFAQVTTLRSSSDLSAESLRLSLLRYKAGEATTLEVVDAQTTASQARSAYDDGLVRYRIALATLQNLTGTLQP